MKAYYTPTEYKDLLGHLCVLCTTNEQVNGHIKAYFDEKGIIYADKSLKTGDYSMRINAAPELGFPIDAYFTDELFIERKNSLSELASSINNEAFHYELKRARNIKHKYLLVEQPDGWQGILSHNYPNKYSEKSFFATLNTFEVEYGLKIKFVPKQHMGLVIYGICKSVLDSTIIK